VGEGCADAGHLVGGDRNADTGAADQDAAVVLTVDDGFGQALGQVSVKAGLAEIADFKAALGGEMGLPALSAPIAIFMAVSFR
jgi:hypothetical protein